MEQVKASSSPSKSFLVTVRTESAAIRFRQFGIDSASVHMAALDRFGACGVTVFLA